MLRGDALWIEKCESNLSAYGESNVKDQIGRTTEVYVDDMLVKSRQSNDHIRDLAEMFDILRHYGMKINPSKCSFGVASRKFLGFIVNARGIEANPEKIQAIRDIQAPRTIKQV